MWLKMTYYERRGTFTVSEQNKRHLKNPARVLRDKILPLNSALTLTSPARAHLSCAAQ